MMNQSKVIDLVSSSDEEEEDVREAPPLVDENKNNARGSSNESASRPTNTIEDINIHIKEKDAEITYTDMNVNDGDVENTNGGIASLTPDANCKMELNQSLLNNQMDFF